jgi:hypothetical protein
MLEGVVDFGVDIEDHESRSEGFDTRESPSRNLRTNSPDLPMDFNDIENFAALTVAGVTEGAVATLLEQKAQGVAQASCPACGAPLSGRTTGAAAQPLHRPSRRPDAPEPILQLRAAFLVAGRGPERRGATGAVPRPPTGKPLPEPKGSITHRQIYFSLGKP